MARMLACPATFDFANKLGFFPDRIVSPFSQIVVCHLAAINSCCLKLLDSVLVTLIELFYRLLAKVSLARRFGIFRFFPLSARERS